MTLFFGICFNLYSFSSCLNDVSFSFKNLFLQVLEVYLVKYKFVIFSFITLNGKLTAAKEQIFN